jgi:hypothetical protein
MEWMSHVEIKGAGLSISECGWSSAMLRYISGLSNI